MQLRHISPRSIEWMDAMDEAGGAARGWEKLAPEERLKLRAGDLSLAWEQRDDEEEED